MEIVSRVSPGLVPRSICHSQHFVFCNTGIRCICILMQVLTGLRLFERNHKLFLKKNRLAGSSVHSSLAMSSFKWVISSQKNSLFFSFFILPIFVLLIFFSLFLWFSIFLLFILLIFHFASLFAFQVPGGRLAEFAGSKRVFGWTMGGVRDHMVIVVVIIVIMVIVVVIMVIVVVIMVIEVVIMVIVVVIM